MTVCIAAICEDGKTMVSATDGMLSLSDVAADRFTGKMYWINQWLFMYAGTVGEVELVFEELFHINEADPASLTRDKIQAALRKAYRKRLSKWSADRFLGAFDIEMDEFKKSGLNIFGEAHQAELAREIQNDASNFDLEIIAVGWGKSDNAAMIYRVGPYGVSSHALVGFAAIGLGANVALSTMMILGQARHSSFEDTIYTVAAAKFAAELCPGVGQNTTMFISRKSEAESAEPVKDRFLTADELGMLRELWDEHGKPRIDPLMGGRMVEVQAMVKRLGGWRGSTA